MNGQEFALIVIGFLAVLLVVTFVGDWLLGPDVDLEPNLDEPVRFAPCGRRDCDNPHPYRPWHERVR